MTEIRERNGCARLFTRDGQYYTIRYSEHDRVKAEWMAGRAFVETVGVYGDPVTIKMAEIQGIRLLSAEVMAAAQADSDEEAREQKKREKLLDMLDDA